MTVRLSERIMDRALKAGADAIVTPCPLCQMNLDLLPSLGSTAPVIPTLFLSEVFELALYGRTGRHEFPPRSRRRGAEEDQGGMRPWRGKRALDYIKAQDPEGGERLKRLLERRSLLLDRNIYGERFTERQFDLVFDPLLRSAYEKAQILELLSEQGRARWRRLRERCPWARRASSTI